MSRHVNLIYKYVMLGLRGFDMIIKGIGSGLSYPFEYPYLDITC